MRAGSSMSDEQRQVQRVAALRMWAARGPTWRGKDGRRRATNRDFYTLKLTSAERQEIMSSQGERCAICGVSEGLVIDHDHLTGRVRGVLCTPCNVALAALKDDPKIAARAVDYLSTR